jgi:hypothetical protein
MAAREGGREGVLLMQENRKMKGRISLMAGMNTLPCDVCKRQCFSVLLPGSSLFMVKEALNAA